MLLEYPLPVRTIPKNHLFVTGRFSSIKSKSVSFESPLEKELMLLLDFDDSVEDYEEQPVRIPVPGVPRGYVPDLLVHFKEQDHKCNPPELIEVKKTEYLEANADEYRAKFLAAEHYAQERGWVFVQKTEIDIRTPRLANIKFVKGFRHACIAEDLCQILLSTVASSGPVPSQDLVPRLPRMLDESDWYPVLWHLVATKRLAADFDTLWREGARVWIPGDKR